MPRSLRLTLFTLAALAVSAAAVAPSGSALPDVEHWVCWDSYDTCQGFVCTGDGDAKVGVSCTVGDRPRPF